MKYVDYFNKCLNAIIEGLKVVVSNWPSDSPFHSEGN